MKSYPRKSGIFFSFALWIIVTVNRTLSIMESNAKSDNKVLFLRVRQKLGDWQLCFCKLEKTSLLQNDFGNFRNLKLASSTKSCIHVYPRGSGTAAPAARANRKYIVL